MLKTDHSMTRDTTYVLKNSKSWVGLKKEQEKKKQEAAAKKAGRKGAKEGEEAKADDAEAQENAEETQA